MTTTNEISPNGYAVVWFGDDGVTPQVCKGMANGIQEGGQTYAIFDDFNDAVAEFIRWPHDGTYGIIPASVVIEERPRYVIKDSAKG